MAVVAPRPPTTHHVNPQHMSAKELDSLAASLGEGRGKKPLDASLLSGAKPPSLKELLEKPVQFISRGVAEEDEIPYVPINVKVPPGKLKNPLPSSPDSSSGSPVASTSKTPAASSSSTATSSFKSTQRLFPLVDTSPTWNRPHGVGAGLHNLGNTCFLNSALQCLLHTPPLVRYLESNAHQSPCDLHTKKGFCMTCAMKLCVKQSFGGKKSYAPSVVTRNLKILAKHFRLGRQEDSHEFLRFCIDAMQSSALQGKGTKLPLPLQHQTFVHQLFGGRLRSRVHCQSCGHNSDTFDSILDLSLDLGNRADSLRDALSNLVKVDRLTGGNKYKCEKCKKLVNAEKSFTIEDAPQVLTIHLKRFTPLGKKINGLIKYPEVLKLGPYMSNPSLDPTYRLYALILHSGGGPHSGHYTAYVRASNGKWHDMNDDYVSSASPSGQGGPLASRNAYVLFYTREKGDSLKGAIQAGVVGAAEKGVNGNGKRARESFPNGINGGGSAAGTPVKRVKPDQAAPPPSSSPAASNVRIPFASNGPAVGAGPPQVLTASKPASPRVSLNAPLAANNPFVIPSTTKKDPASPPKAPSAALPSPSSSSSLMTPVPAKQFVSRLSQPSTASSASSSSDSPFSSLTSNGLGAKKPKVNNKGNQHERFMKDGMGKKAAKKAAKEAKRALMGLVVPPSATATESEGGGKFGGKKEKSRFAGGTGKGNRPRVLTD
ncbi:hypothetical protein JCM8547_005285 [Rhodosporidiobolus lusitaniae]